MPRLSVIVLTWNEERNVRGCLDALGRQTNLDIEVILLDAASTDRTVAIVREAQPGLPYPLHLEVAPRRTSVGEARNRGVQLARAPLVAFLSADAEPEPGWVQAALAGLDRADIVYGRQIHDPHARTVSAAVRGLHYHFPAGPTEAPERFASHVNAAMRRELLTSFPIGTTPGASAVDDVLLARRALDAGFRVAYDPGMLVRHHDVDSWRAEWAKARREGLGWGEHVDELGANTGLLAWGLLLAVGIALAAILPSPFTLLLLLALLWLPALRRAWRRRREMPARDVALGVLASPLFDLAFLLAYLRGRLLPKGPLRAARGNEVDT